MGAFMGSLSYGHRPGAALGGDQGAMAAGRVKGRSG